MGSRLLGPMVLGWVLLSGCAAAPRMAPATVPVVDDAGDAKALQEALDELKEHKSSMVMPRAESSCQPMCRIAELICRASERICAIAARHPDDPTYEQRCKGAQTDCHDGQTDCDRCQ